MTALISRLVHRVDQTLRQAGDRVPMHAESRRSVDLEQQRVVRWLLARAVAAMRKRDWRRAVRARGDVFGVGVAAAPADEQTVLRGHLFFYGAARVDPQLATDAGAALCEAFDHGAGLISPGDEDTHRYGWPRRSATASTALPPVVGLLTLAGRQDLAVKHVRRHAELCVREGRGSVAQTAARDGARANHSGASPQGTWARAQAWAMLGLAQAVRVEPELTAIAGREADWWLAHLPADGISRWGVRRPDSSAGHFRCGDRSRGARDARATSGGRGGRGRPQPPRQPARRAPEWFAAPACRLRAGVGRLLPPRGCPRRSRSQAERRLSRTKPTALGNRRSARRPFRARRRPPAPFRSRRLSTIPAFCRVRIFPGRLGAARFARPPAGLAARRPVSPARRAQPPRRGARGATPTKRRRHAQPECAQIVESGHFVVRLERSPLARVTTTGGVGIRRKRHCRGRLWRTVATAEARDRGPLAGGRT